ncbi:hypothetical protein F4780DRAFT_781424 [Xylariomycetidae sp. FL0641]|nr:hypothetical protein F4780DRAFT_781424 [Xylariomycetidae sp. FL0641]
MDLRAQHKAQTVRALVPRVRLAPLLPTTRAFVISSGEYYLGVLGTTAIATLLSIAIRTIDPNAQLLAPFRRLSRAGGAPAADSLCLEGGGPLDCPCSSTAACKPPRTAPGRSLGVFPRAAARGAEGRLASLMLLSVVALRLLATGRRAPGRGSGSPSGSWSVAGTAAALAGSPEVRATYHRLAHPDAGHGVVVLRQARGPARGAVRGVREKKKRGPGVAGRLLFLFVLAGLCGRWSRTTATRGRGYAPFERFVDGEGFGVGFLFTAVGVAVTFCWGAVFTVDGATAGAAYYVCDSAVLVVETTRGGGRDVRVHDDPGLRYSFGYGRGVSGAAGSACMSMSRMSKPVGRLSRQRRHASGLHS